DDLGRTVTYTYDAQGRLSQVTDPAGGTEQYFYDSANNMTSIKDKRGNTKVTNTYDSNNRVIGQAYPDGSSCSFSYTLDSAGTSVVQTDFTDRRGTIIRRVFDSNGYPTQLIRALGRPEEQDIYYTRDPNTNQVTAITDALSRTTYFSYDEIGNPISVTRAVGTSNQASASVQYGAYQMITSVTDENGFTSHMSYDQFGNLVSLSDPLNHVWTYTHDGQGNLLTVTDPNGNAISFAYLGADLSVSSDGLGNQVHFTTDAAGRPTAVQDSVGSKTSRTYDLL